jgi:hypothetical protein
MAAFLYNRMQRKMALATILYVMCNLNASFILPFLRQCLSGKKWVEGVEISRRALLRQIRVMPLKSWTRSDFRPHGHVSEKLKR